MAAPAPPYVPNVQERLSSGAKPRCSAECPSWCCHPGLASLLISSISQEQQEEQDTGKREMLLHLLECVGIHDSAVSVTFCGGFLFSVRHL